MTSSIRTFRTFLAICDTGSFTAAAQRVALTPAAVGAQMKALEDELGRALFERVNRGVLMTPAAQALVPRARRIVDEYEQIVAEPDAGSRIAGGITVGAVTSATGLLAATVLQMKALYPELEVTLVNDRRPELLARVLSGEMDAAIIAGVIGRKPEGTQWHPLYREPLMLVCSSQVASPRSDPARLLRTQPFISFDHTGSSGMRIGRLLKRAGIQPKAIVEMNSATGIVELVRQNAGIAIVPVLHDFHWASDDTLCLLPLPGRRLEREVGVLRNLRRAHITDVLLKHLTARLRPPAAAKRRP